MPVQEGYEYADVAHAKTVAGDGWLYGCHSSKMGDDPRGRFTYYQAAQLGEHEYDPDTGEHAQVPTWVWIKTDWNPIKCGHTLRGTDPACTGCINREE